MEIDSQTVKTEAEISWFFSLFGEIDNDTAKDVVEWIITANFAQQNKPTMLNLIINSEGGSLYDAFAIIDVMKSSTIPIRTIGLGCIMSAGLMIFMAGTKGERVLTPNTAIMSHQYSSGSIGKAHELFAAQKDFEMTDTRMINHYKQYTELTEAKIRKYLLPSSDIFLTAEEAKKLNICDRVALLM